MNDYKITRSQTQQGEFVDKWYIRPAGIMFCCDKDVLTYFNIGRDDFDKVIKKYGGTIHSYRSWFPTKETATNAAELLAADALMRRLVV